MCIQEPINLQAGCFLFINSRGGYADNLMLQDSEIPCLYPSPTGQSIISCSQVVRATKHQLTLFACVKKGEIPVNVARKLEKFVKSVRTLTADERNIVLSALSQIT